MLFLFIALLVSPLWAQPKTDLDSVAVDSLRVLLAEPEIDSVLAGLGDSLFVPPPDRARIVRDRYGVPHIYGATDLDVAFGFGFAQAQDHLIPMLLSYRMAKGEAAEVNGPEAIESDFKSRLWRIDRVSGELYGTIPEHTRDLIGAFADGVNHYIEIHSQVLPEWVKRIRGTDIVASTRWLMLNFVERQGAPELSAKGLLRSSRALGSNQVVVAPTRSVSGRTLAMSDLHLPWQIPFRLYEAHLVSGEGMNVYGGTFFGWPVIAFGYNERITWSFTVNDADVFDLYEIKLDPANPRRYLFEREKQRISSRRAKIRVRRENGVEEVSRELLYTHHGPVYKIGENWAYSAKAPIEDIVDVVGQLYEMGRSQSLQEFRTAVSRLQIPMFNVMYGDRDGTTYYAFLARSPLRSQKFEWRAPVPGWTKDSEWRGLLPFSQLPQMVNPVAGFMQNCNTPPDAVTTQESLDASDYPATLGWGRMTDRGRRARTWLAARQTIALKDLISLSRDTYLVAAEELKGFILRGHNHFWQEIYDPNARIAEAVNLLRAWNNRADADERAVLLFAAWHDRFTPLVDQLPLEQREDVRVLERVALDALQQAVAYVLEAYGRLDVRWGSVHVIERGNNRYPVGGSPDGLDALHATWSAEGDDAMHRVTGGSSFTLVVALDEKPEAWTLTSFGNSERADSPHYVDQAERQADGRLKQAWFAPEDVVAYASTVVTVPFEDEGFELERLKARWRARLEQEEAEVAEAQVD